MKKRLELIIDKIDDIEFFIAQKNNKIIPALEDRILKPAIRMQIISIAEQFNKLKEENEFELLAQIDKESKLNKYADYSNVILLLVELFYEENSLSYATI